MCQPSFFSVAAVLSGRLPRPGVSTAMFGACLLFAFALPSQVVAHEVHSAAQPQTAAVRDEAPFLKENDAAMIKMMKEWRLSRPAMSTAISSS
jgi:hypothetical protein